MGKVSMKKSTIGGLTSRRVRQIVQQRTQDDRKYLQDQNNLSAELENSSAGVSGAPLNQPSMEFKVEATAEDNFILNDKFHDSYSSDNDSEITSNENARMLDSDYDNDHFDEDDPEFPQFPKSPEKNIEKTQFTVKLREWALKFHITLIALSALLLLFRDFDVTLPLDARTLLGTPRRTEIVEMCGGSYHHFGLRRAVENIFLGKRRNSEQDQDIKLILNVDGLPISKSGTNSFWLLLCSEINSETVYPIGAFYGTKKPINANEFLTPFVNEAITVCENGINNTKVMIDAVVCDAPAKSFVLYLKGHTGYSCCSKCLIEGECYRPPASTKGKRKKGRVCFPGIGPFILKNDNEFVLNIYTDKESCEQTVLTKLPRFGCVTSIPLDYMHLILLGVMKKLISLWLNGPLKVRLPSDVVQAISERLMLLKNTIPEEFNRRPRTLWEFKFWKATEFRTFLLYAGVVALKNLAGFPVKLYSHFLLLHTAVSILLSEIHLSDTKNIDAAHEMLQLFVKDFEKLYGKEHISYNVHNLLHICEDVRRYGIMGKFSAFRFENYMSTVKRMLRKGDKPLQQIARRYAESENKTHSSVNELTLHEPHNRGPLMDYSSINVPEQYTALKNKEFCIDCKVIKNSCVLLKDGTFLLTENILKYGTNDIWLIGHKLCFKSNLYNCPDSRLLNIHIAHDGNPNEKFCVPLTDVLSKVWKIPTSEGEVLIPLLHTREQK